jgi:hypothetical protein
VSFATAANAQAKLPERYIELINAGITRIEKNLELFPSPTLRLIEREHQFAHFPHAILLPAVLYAKSHPLNKHYNDPAMLTLAEKIGDMLVKENDNGNYGARQDTDWDTYMWLEAYRILENRLGDKRREEWKRVLLKNLQPLHELLVKYRKRPWYNAPFIVTSPNHYSIYASTLLVGGTVFHNAEWVTLSSEVLHRFCVSEQTGDGYWGEHSQAGPTTGYDYVTSTQIGVYYEFSRDPDALKALRRSTDFHKYFTYPDGTPVETINDRNRYWGVSMWGQFGFSNFPDGRSYSEMLVSYFPVSGDSLSYGGDWQSLGRLAQDFLYYHEGKKEPIPQQQTNYAHPMKIAAGIRKTGSWVTTYSGIIAPMVTLNNFFLDRQGNISVFNEKTGLIISGANSKRQPELATLTEVIGKDSIHMPVSSKLVMNNVGDTLSLAYNIFYADLVFPRPSGNQLSFKMQTHYKWGDAITEFNLQLMLTAGEELITGAGKKYVLGTGKLELTDADLGGSIEHHGWKLTLPKGMKLTWPVYPFNPYRDANETEISKAIGRLSIPLKQEDEEMQFSISVDVN